MRTIRVAAAALGVIAVTTCAACTAGGPGPLRAPRRDPVTHRNRSERPQPAPARHIAKVAPSQPDPSRIRRQQLPHGGTKILGHYRVVAYYGAPGGGGLGILGADSPAHAARGVIARARGYRGYGLRVQPAMELIATVAQSTPGPDGTYSAPVPHAQIRRYLRVAHRDKMLLVLDLQPGRAGFLSQVKSLGNLLLDPSVGVALDSEWKVGPHQRPGDGRIGSCRAKGINAVSRYLSKVVSHNALPDKLMIVHEFTPTMLPDRSKIVTAPGVEVVFHADGFGSPAVKKGVYHQLNFPGRPYGTGFKLFLTQDSRLMRPAAVMRLHRRPDVITYQ